MSANFYDLLKYAATGQASPSMTFYDRMRASALMGGGVQTLTGQPPLSFKADGSPLISWSMKGNGQQTGTPTPDAPITPDFVGTLSGSDWTIPISCAGQTAPVNLDEVQTVRKVKKFVFDGTENWLNGNFPKPGSYQFNLVRSTYFPDAISTITAGNSYCTHFINREITGGIVWGSMFNIYIPTSDLPPDATKDDFKAFLAAQYAAGTPVTIWYPLATETIGISNEPLAKIGDYADELHSTDAGVTIPTVKGENTLTVGTDLQPSEMAITYRG